jgi:predicted Zn-dependent peptidase
VAAETLEREVGQAVDGLQKDPVNDAEIARALALIETDFTAALQAASDRADKLSQFATYFGDPGLLNVQLDKYRAVTADQVNAFAREWLGENNRASLLYVPRDGQESDELEGDVTESSGASAPGAAR